MSDTFLRMIQMIIAPLVFATIISGISSLGANGAAVGRIAFRALGWFITASPVSLFIGLLPANVLRPGHGLNLPLPEAGATTNLQAGSLNLMDLAAHVFPISIVQAMATNEVLQRRTSSVTASRPLSSRSGRTNSVLRSRTMASSCRWSAA